MERIWVDSYPAGIPAEITDEANKYESLVSLIEEACGRNKDRTAFFSLGASMSYAEFDKQAGHFAAWLQSRGLKKGDRVALMMPNLLQYPVCLLGTMRAGGVVVNVNPMYTAPELNYQLRDSGATFIVIAENFASTLQNALKDTAIETIVVTAMGDLLGSLRGTVTNLVIRHIKKLVPAYHLPGSLLLKQVLAQGAKASFTTPSLNHDDMALLQYTGGTTGVAKGAVLTHGNMVSNICQAHAWVTPYINGPQCVITALPLYHIFALTANCLTFIVIGASNVLIVNPRDIPAVVKEMRKHRFTALTGVNTLFNAFLLNEDFKKLDFSSLKITLGGGMAVHEVIAKRWLACTGTPIAQAYGLTETSPAVTINPLDKREFTGSIGLPVPSTDIAIRDDNAHDMAQGESGEICVRGPQVTPGYWQRPDETAKVLDADGFLHTGDIGYVDAQGYVFLLDRKKDMINVSGFNVYPNEIEAVAAEHPDVKEAAAIGVPSEHSGEAVKLFVIRKNNQVTEKELIDFCRDKLTRYKVPKFVEFRDDFPRSNVGKVLRRELKEDTPAKAAPSQTS